jgi:osmoprotectant transport system substrate-binding protein
MQRGKFVAPIVALVVLLTACAAPTGSGAKPTVKVGSTNFDEQLVLAEVYGQVLEANGYRIDRKFNLGNREIVAPAIEKGEIDMYVEYLATYATYLTKDANKASSDANATMKVVQDALQPKSMSVLGFAPAVDRNVFVVTKATSDRHNLKRMSDLTPVATQLSLGGPAECPQRPFCAPGVERVYNAKFKEFKPLDSGGNLTVQALESGQIDVALLFSSDPVIVQKGFVALEDDKGLQLADNVAPVVRNDVISKSPSGEIQRLFDSVNQKLTTQELLDLNKGVRLDRKEPKDVAAAWLKAKGITK